MTLKTTNNPKPAHARNSAGLSCALAAVLALSGCGGGSSSAVDSSGGTSPGVKPVLLANCLDGNQPNVVGVDDPFYVNSWHLENTGLAQVVSGQMHLEIELGNATSTPVNPGRVQFEMTNQRTGQTSILLPAFTAWYVGGKQFTMAPESITRFRLHTNAFYGDRLGDGYSIKTIYIRPAGAASGGGQLDYRATVTSFSL